MKYSGLLKQYLINNGTYVDKKMEPLQTKADLDNFNVMWMFPGLKVTVLNDVDGQMRDYRCKLDSYGAKIWVAEENVSQETFDVEVGKLENANEVLSGRVDAIEGAMTIQGSDLEK